MLYSHPKICLQVLKLTVKIDTLYTRMMYNLAKMLFSAEELPISFEWGIVQLSKQQESIEQHILDTNAGKQLS
jgi:hypothetical protein